MRDFYKPNQDCAYDSDEYELVGNEEFEDVPDSPVYNNVEEAERAGSDSGDSFNPDETDSDDDDGVVNLRVGANNDNGDDDDDDDDDDEDEEDDNDDTNHNVGVSAGAGASSHYDEQTAMEADEDEVIQRIIAETKKERDHPPDISTDDFVFDICFHPHENLLAVGTIAGDVVLYKYSNTENTIVSTLEVHTKAVRDIDFSDDGQMLVSVSKDKSIMLSSVETSQLKRFYDKSHEHPIYCLHVINENLFATGDDDGTLKVWDLRTSDSNPLFSLRIVEDYISQMLTNDAKKLLIASSGDGYLTAVHLGQRKMYVQSEPYEEELNCMGLFRNDSKLVAGSSKGNLYSYNWGEFGLHSDKFPGPKSGINCMLPITNRISVVAGEEGVIRAMHVVPGRNLGVVGQHSLGIETMDICNSGEFIASSSHDNDIRFWNIKYFEDFDDIKYNTKHNEPKAQRNNLPSSRNVNASDFFSDLAP